MTKLKQSIIIPIKKIILLSLLINSISSKICDPKITHCSECNTDNLCIECDSHFILNIESKPFTCDPCPKSCKNKCGINGCLSCKTGFYKYKFQKFDQSVYLCKKCSLECEACEYKPESCTSCPEYYQLMEDHTCIFKYTRLILVGLILIALLTMFMIFLIIKCVCFEKPPEKANFANILDKDPELLSDHYKVQRVSIGTSNRNTAPKKFNDDLTLSIVIPADEDVQQGNYLNISNVSNDPVLSQLVNASPNINNYSQYNDGLEAGSLRDREYEYDLEDDKQKGNSFLN